MRPIAIFRFSETEGPAHFATWLDRMSLPWQLIAVDRGEPIPADVGAYSGIGMMGGPMSVAGPPRDANSAPWGAAQRREPQAWGDRASVAGPSRDANSAPWGAAQRREPQAWGDRASVAGPSRDADSAPPGASAAAPAAEASADDALEWFEPLSQLLRDAIAADIPVIGHCLGGQLLARALGAAVQRTAVPEIGWIDVETTDTAAQRAWFGGRPRFTPFQWHYDVFDLPPGATRVLTNAFNPNQAYVIGDRHIGFQCHVEMTRDLVLTWCRTGADEIAGPGTPPRQSRDEILRDMPARLDALQAIADGVYARWSQGLRR